MNRRYQLLLILVVASLDRLTKMLIVRHIPLDQAVNVIPNFFRLVHYENSGAAFSIFADSPSPWKAALLIAVSSIVLVIIGVLLWRRKDSMDAPVIALCLVFGGALGNLADRLAGRGVVDFLDFYIGSHHWWPFNLADSAIVSGAVLLLLTAFPRKTEA